MKVNPYFLTLGVGEVMTLFVGPWSVGLQPRRSAAMDATAAPPSRDPLKVPMSACSRAT